MAEVTKGDLMFFQNEILSDLKKLETKLNNKLDLSIEEIKVKLTENDTKNANLSEKFEDLTNLLNNNNDKDKNDEIKKLQKFKSNMEEFTSKIRIKTDKLETELDNTNYKFDKILNWNLTLPGIIGTEKCKFKSLREFLDFTNKTIQTLNTNKDKNNIDLKSYKDKLETNIRSFGLQIDNVTNKFKEFCNNTLKQCEGTFMKRCEETDEKVQTLRIENSRFTLELVNECEKLKIQQKDLDQYKNDLENRYSEHLKKQDELYKNLLNKFNEYEKEFKLIKNKFTELSEFIKNVRFRKNIGDTIKIQEFREMSKKIDFDNKRPNYNEFDIDVPDFIMDNEENIKNYLKEKEDKKKIVNNKINYNNVQSEIKKYIESDYHRKLNNEDNQNNTKLVSFNTNVKDYKNTSNMNYKRNKTNKELPPFNNNKNNNYNDNNDLKTEKPFIRNYKYSRTINETSQRENFNENYNNNKQIYNNNYNNNNNNNNFSSHRTNNENNFDSKSAVYNNNMNNENISIYTIDNKSDVYGLRENNFDNNFQRAKIRNKTQMYNNKYRMNTAPNENISDQRYFKRNNTIKSNKEKSTINCNKSEKIINNVEQKDLTYADLTNLVNNENENQTKNKNNNIDNNNAYSNFLMKNQTKTNKLNKIFNTNFNKKAYNISDTNFNIINSNTNNNNFNILYNNTDIKLNENNTISLNEDNISKKNNENKENNNNEINNENTNDIYKIKNNLLENNKISEVKQFLNINDNKSKIKKSHFDDNEVNKKESINEKEILNSSFSPDNKITKNLNLEIIDVDENINTKEINELVDNLTPKVKYNELFVNNIKNKNNNINVNNNTNKNNNNNDNNNEKNLDSIKLNITELVKKIDGTQIKMNLLEERTNKKLNDINEQLKTILSKISGQSKKKLYHTMNNFYNHNSLEENEISKALLNSIVNKKNNSIPKKVVNSNINSRIRLLKQNQTNNNIKVGNHFAPLSMEIDKIH